jgi:CMP-N,N'-diacetyllegionaminic acid synthase
VITWAFVPARGGSKSIQFKNMVELDGRPMLDFGIQATKASSLCERIVVSTDNQDIASRALTLDVEVDTRPEHLGGDDVLVDDVVRDFLSREAVTRPLPDVILLVQPTSPFLLPEHISELLGVMKGDPGAMSAHNVVAVQHNAHAWNQRSLQADGRVDFLFEARRNKARQKQQKPDLKIFGNLIAARSSALSGGAGFYAPPCAGIEIKQPYNWDVDGPADLVIAQTLLHSGSVLLPHMQQLP